VRTLSFDISPLADDLEQARLANCVAQMLPNAPNIRYLIIGCHARKTVTYSAITDAIAKLQCLECVALSGSGYGPIDESYSLQSPTFFDTIFNEIISSHAEQLTSLSLDLCPFNYAPGTFQLVRETMKNLQVLILNASLPRSHWQVFAQPVIWACADRLIMLDITEMHGAYVPILVEHIASGRFGNLKRLLIDMHWADRDRHIVAPAIAWSIRPLDVLALNHVPRLELEIFGCLHSKEVHAEGVSEQAMIELVQGGSFEEMVLLGIRQQDWKCIRLEELASACANRKVELLFI